MSNATHDPKLPFIAITLLVAVWQGMIGIFVKWVTWPPAAMVCFRCAVASLGLSCLALAMERRSRSMEPATAGKRASPPRSVTKSVRGSQLALGGALLAGHWATLFWAYRVANVGPVVVSVFTFPVMASLAEPWFFGGRPRQRQVLLAALVVVGVAIMTRTGTEQTAASGANGQGIVLGLVSAAFFTARNIVSRRQLAGVDPIRLMARQTLVAAVLMAPSLAWLSPEDLSGRNLVLLTVLGIGFTALSHTLIMWSMKHLSVTATGIIGSLQVVASILFARWLLGEVASPSVWLGAASVTLAVFVESWRARGMKA